MCPLELDTSKNRQNCVDTSEMNFFTWYLLLMIIPTIIQCHCHVHASLKKLNFGNFALRLLIWSNIVSWLVPVRPLTSIILIDHQKLSVDNYLPKFEKRIMILGILNYFFRFWYIFQIQSVSPERRSLKWARFFLNTIKMKQLGISTNGFQLLIFQAFNMNVKKRILSIFNHFNDGFRGFRVFLAHPVLHIWPSD